MFANFFVSTVIHLLSRCCNGDLCGPMRTQVGRALDFRKEIQHLRRTAIQLSRSLSTRHRRSGPSLSEESTFTRKRRIEEFRARSNTMDRITVASSQFAANRYNARQRGAASFLQAFVRTHSLAEALKARSRMLLQVRDGVQFAQRVVYGLEGDTSKVAILRGKCNRQKECVIELSVTNLTAHQGVDFEVDQEFVILRPGERFVVANIRCLSNGVAMVSSSDSWRPIREAVLSLSIVPESNDHDNDLAVDTFDAESLPETKGLDALPMLGEVSECRLRIVDTDKWPGVPWRNDTDWSQSGTYMTSWTTYVKAIFRKNLEGTPSSKAHMRTSPTHERNARPR